MTLSGDQIFMLVLSTIIAVIAFFLKDLKKQNDDKHRELGEQNDKLRDELTKLITSLPHMYVLRDTFIREIGSLNTKVDQISRDIGELNKNVSKLAGGAKGE
jgi:pyruvate-formate lyase-activating enzyme